MAFFRSIISPLRHFTSLSNFPSQTSNLTSTTSRIPTLVSSFQNIFLQQIRFKSRGNTYQPSVLVRKRRHGFLARLESGQKILTRRRMKGRKFLTC